MFTGLIEKVGRLGPPAMTGGGSRISIRHDPWDVPLVPGESICVQGACLTVTEASRDLFACDVLDETLSRTTLGRLGNGTLLNLERALRATDRLGGHMVTGHVDGLGRVTRWDSISGDRILRIECDELLRRGIVEKGSVACDGVSLTVSVVADRVFEVRVIPETWNRTSLRQLSVGSLINIETDIVGKYVLQYVQLGKTVPSITMDSLMNAGFC